MLPRSEGQKLAPFSVCVYVASAPILPCGASQAQSVPVLGSVRANHHPRAPSCMWKRNHCLVPCSGSSCSEWLRLSIEIQCLGSFPGSFGSVWASFPSDRQNHGLQQWAAECSLFCLSSLYHSSATPSLFLTLSLSALPTHTHTHCSLFCPAGEQGLIWRVHNSCSSLAFSGAPQVWPGPKVQCQIHMVAWKDWNPHLLSRLCGAITRSHPCP